ncbi:3-deoxy-D-manno-octulosonic acid transferase [Octadecabacter sp. G9-8]|uniref:3-deoxy-D-manno-octulosonic acid transferase n=1 Tax=Octadecabacter dasysiphoniae TaxID=2909341 RepID=A0ABS9D1D9_9RHOB|nr:glycosyltransferase N-terminal domain-containing protein [Octadecabacter dasysiphoniae]MCF2872460.1 3-deoxy-D-manno-octulosonic acid transferase [Octadecabacter dasysiphoniae]
MTSKPKIGPMLRLVLGVGALLQPFARPVLTRRLTKGKEDPDRWREKLGQTDAQRPDGPLIWMHGVGVGEVMALRGLIDALSRERPDLNFLVTSSARSSGDVFAKNLPARTQHQYLPLDLPGPVAAFLDHWRPDLAVWSDQEIWPRFAVEAARRSIPQAYVAARITDASAKAKSRFGQAYGDLYRILDLRHAQDAGTAAHLHALMGDDTPVAVTGSLKPAAAPLTFSQNDLTAFVDIRTQRGLWLVASSHSADETVALKAHKILRQTQPDAILLIAPRDAARAPAIAQTAQDMGLPTSLRSDTDRPGDSDAVYIADSYAELGTWYRATQIALIGGTFDATEGHNPWEAVPLHAAILHGSRTANFDLDFKALHAGQACKEVTDAASLATALLDPATINLHAAAITVRRTALLNVRTIADDLFALLRP